MDNNYFQEGMNITFRDDFYTHNLTETPRTVSVNTSSPAQHWNDVLSYIKINLGVPVNLLELSDDDLITNLRQHVMGIFSQYVPRKAWSYISGKDIVYSSVLGSPRYMAKIPVPEGTYIIDVLEAYPTKEVSIVDMYGGALISAQAAMDLVISNAYIDAVRSLQHRNTWEFLPPDTMIFDKETLACVVVYNTTHSTLDTIRPDLYHKCFKPLCLGYTKIWIAAMRSKFEGLATPFGQLNLNFAELKAEGQTLIDNTIAILETIPPDILIEIS